MSSVFNRRWAAVLLESLTRHGVRHICIAPGSRSTPLTLEADANPKLCCHTHVDERGLGHLALGLAKASKEPVAVIVTSGTAVANLYPAVIEAGLTGERLIMLTADRPPELINCGANQAIRQEQIFASHPVQSLHLPRPTPDISAAWLASSVDSLMARLDHGALHINCPFAEPLYGDDAPQVHKAWSEGLGTWWQESTPWLMEDAPYQGMTHTEPDWMSWRERRGVVVIGRVDAAEGQAAARWGQQLGWPVLGDVLSQSGQPLPHADLWLGHPEARRVLAQTEMIVQFGAFLTGKRLMQWHTSCQPQALWLIDPLPGRLDPSCHRGRRIVAPIGQWLEQHPAHQGDPWAAELEGLVQRTVGCVQSAVGTSLGEAQIAHGLNTLLPPQGQLFVGNSLIIRLIDALGQLPAGYPVYGNRGASGIDGLIATLAGVQRAGTKPTLGVIGDLSAVYDINSLALLRNPTAPVVVLVINNNGGQIFSMLPTPEAQRERLYVMPQHIDFQHAASLFALHYACPQTWEALREVVSEGWKRSETTLVEVRVQPHEGSAIWRALLGDVTKL